MSRGHGRHGVGGNAAEAVVRSGQTGTRMSTVPQGLFIVGGIPA